MRYAVVTYIKYNFELRRITMNEKLKELAVKELQSTYEGLSFLKYQHENGQNMCDLQRKIMDVLQGSNLTVSVAKGFLDYLKIVVESSSTLQSEK